MNIFVVLSLNIASFTYIATKVNENGLPGGLDELWMVLLFAVNAICNIYYIVGKEIKKSQRKGPISGTFIPNHDVDEIDTVGR